MHERLFDLRDAQAEARYLARLNLARQKFAREFAARKKRAADSQRALIFARADFREAYFRREEEAAMSDNLYNPKFDWDVETARESVRAAAAQKWAVVAE